METEVVSVVMLKKLAGSNINIGEQAGWSRELAADLVKQGIARYIDVVDTFIPPAAEVEPPEIVDILTPAKKTFTKRV